MPPGALERAFNPVLRILAQKPQHTAKPFSIKYAAAVFAGDHSVAKLHGVSAFPPEVTGQMVLNFVFGGAAMSALCRRRSAPLYVVDVGVAYHYDKPATTAKNITFLERNIAIGLLGSEKYPSGASDITTTAALSPEAYRLALQVGRETVEKLIHDSNPDVIILGDMGIGNTTPSTAIICQTLGLSPEMLTGPGTGINAEQKSRKTTVISKAINRHNTEFTSAAANPEVIVRSLGGFELVAIAGAALAAAEYQKHILLDGIISTAAILPFALSSKEFRSWIICGHIGSEPSHQAAVNAIGEKALLNLDLRLGEGSGAALAAGIIDDALAMLNEMATFESAGVSDKSK